MNPFGLPSFGLPVLPSLSPDPQPPLGYSPDIAAMIGAGANAGSSMADLLSMAPPNPIAEAARTDPGVIQRRTEDVSRLVPQNRPSPPIPEHMPRSAAVPQELLPALDMSNPKWAEGQQFDALTAGPGDGKATGQQSAGFDGSKFLDVLETILGAPRSILQHTVGTILRGGPPGWISQAQAATDAASADALAAQGEFERAQATLQAADPRGYNEKWKPIFASIPDQALQSPTTSAAGQSGSSQPLRARIPWWREMLSSYEDQGNEYARDIMSLRGEAAQKRRMAKEMLAAPLLSGKYADARKAMLGADLYEQYGPEKEALTVEGKRLNNAYMGQAIANYGQGKQESPYTQQSHELDLEAKRLRNERLRNPDSKPPSETEERQQAKLLADIKSGKGQAKGYSEHERAWLFRKYGGTVGTKEDTWMPFESDYDWKKATFPGEALPEAAIPEVERASDSIYSERPTSDAEALLLSQIRTMPKQQARQAVGRAVDSGQIDQTAGIRILGKLGLVLKGR